MQLNKTNFNLLEIYGHKTDQRDPDLVRATLLQFHMQFNFSNI